MKHRRDWKPLLDAVAAAGWRIENAKHGCLAYPGDRTLAPIALGGTTSDWRATRNARAALRRAGLDV